MAVFPSVTKTSTNVKDDLRLAAKFYKADPHDIDFDLLSYETYCKRGNDADWSPLREDNLLAQITQEELYSSEFLLRQEYQIKIHPFVPHQYLDLRFSVAMSKAKGTVTALIDPASTIPLKKGVQEWIKEAINRKKLRLGLLIGMTDPELDEEIKRFLAILQKQGPLTAPYPLKIAVFFPEIPVVNDAIILHYKEQNKNKSMIEGVEPGTLLLEYVFAKYGRNGRGYDGAPIVVPEPIIKYAGLIKIDEATIEAKQDDKSICYYSKISGYVKQEKGFFSVAHELNLESVSMKETGSIEVGIDKEVSLEVNQKLFSEDAVGMGVRIDVQKVDISGTVGENTKIKAEELSIGAQTHRKASMEVTENAKIQLHRGDLRAKEASIDVLEGGRVEADVVRVNKMLGGEIVAREVYVDLLYSHGRITAQELIEINHIEGEGSTLTIDPFSIAAYHDKIAQTQTDIADKETLIREHAAQLKNQEQVYKARSGRIKQFQQRVLKAKHDGQEPMKADMVRLKQYQIEGFNLKESASKLREEEEYLNALNNKLAKLYEADLHGAVINNGSYNGQNRVVFIDPKTRQEYAVLPKGEAKRITLEVHGETKRLRQDSL